MIQQATPPLSRAGALPLVGGALSLDFCNTASGRGTPGLIEHLRAPEHLVVWCSHAGVIDAEAEAYLRARLAAELTFGPGLLARAIELRDAFYRIGTTLAAGCGPDQADIDSVASDHATFLASGRLVAENGAFGWSWDAEAAPEAALLGPVAASATSLVMEADRARLKRCPGHHCGWLFLDTTKNNNRRWCEMEVCGNRAKQMRRRGRTGDA